MNVRSVVEQKGHYIRLALRSRDDKWRGASLRQQFIALAMI
jgi:hypothetical protein